MFNDYKMIEDHFQELLQLSSQTRMALLSNSALPSPWDRTLIRLGDLLISLGVRLQRGRLVRTNTGQA